MNNSLQVLVMNYGTHSLQLITKKLEDKLVLLGPMHLSHVKF